MKRIVLLTIIAFTTGLKAQKGVSHYHGHSLEHLGNKVLKFDVRIDSESELEAFIIDKFNMSDKIDLELTKKISSKAFDHYHFRRTLNGREIFAGEIHAAVLKSGRLKLIQQNNVPEVSAYDLFPSKDLGQTAFSNSGAKNLLEVREVYFPKGDLLYPAIMVTVSGPIEVHRKIILDDSGVLFDQDLVKRYHCEGHHHAGPNDTTAIAYVFDPDPLTTAQVNYGAPYVDNNDADVTSIQAERKVRFVTLTYDNGTFKPENDAVKLVDLSPPTVAPVTRTDDQFLYNRSENGFEDMNVVYHITKHKTHMTSLGYPNIPNYTIEIDPHALNGSDNSVFTFSSGPPYQISFGEGGVDDAEDADVIIHEYTHAVALETAPSGGGTTERNCIEEALGDYFAASYSNSINTFNGDQVFSWDGHNPFWAGRMVSSNKDYQQLSFGSDIYVHTDIFASCLMEINDNLGRNLADELVLESMFNMGWTTNMPQMAGFVIMADSALYNGANFTVIRDAFVRRNIIPQIISIDEYFSHSVQITGTFEFSVGGALQVESERLTIKQVDLLDIQGRTIKSVVSGDERVGISSEGLKPGVYILSIQLTDGGLVSSKVVKTK